MASKEYLFLKYCTIPIYIIIITIIKLNVT